MALVLILLMVFWDTPIGLTVRESWNALPTWLQVVVVILVVLDVVKRVIDMVVE